MRFVSQRSNGAGKCVNAAIRNVSTLSYMRFTCPIKVMPYVITCRPLSVVRGQTGPCRAQGGRTSGGSRRWFDAFVMPERIAMQHLDHADCLSLYGRSACPAIAAAAAFSPHCTRA